LDETLIGEILVVSWGKRSPLGDEKPMEAYSRTHCSAKKVPLEELDGDSMW